MTEVKHHTRDIRIAPRKIRLVIDKVRHMPAADAIALMPLVTKRGALHVGKALKAAVEAAKDQNLNAETLVIQRIWIDEGAPMKRIISRSRGRATGIMKKSSHLTIVLKGDDVSTTKKPKRIAATPAPAEAQEATPTTEETN